MDARDSQTSMIAPTTLPLPAAAILPVGSGPGIDIYSALLPNEELGDALVFEHFNDEFTAGSLRTIHYRNRSIDGVPTSLDLNSAAMLSSPSAVRVGEKTYLYYSTSASAESESFFWRREWLGDSFADAERVKLPEFVYILSWPRVIATGGSSAAVAYRDDRSIPKFARSSDGLSFGAPQTLGPAGSQPEVARFGSGAFAYSYQVGASSPIQSYYRVSADGANWTERALVTTGSNNVHDTKMLLREDGNIDMYFVYPTSEIGFTLFRRCLRESGQLGPEEMVVVAEWGNLAKPNPIRLRDSSILLTFVNQNDGHRLFMTNIQGDSRCD